MKKFSEINEGSDAPSSPTAYNVHNYGRSAAEKGRGVTLEHGAHFSIVLHPHHVTAVAGLKDNEQIAVHTETGAHYRATRHGDQIHFKGMNGRADGKTSVADLSKITK